jgi:YD repeat-containing protein
MSSGAGTELTGSIKTDGTVWTIGWNGWGQLGIGSTTDKNSPVQVGALTTWLSLAVGGPIGVSMAGLKEP